MAIGNSRRLSDHESMHHAHLCCLLPTQTTSTAAPTINSSRSILLTHLMSVSFSCRQLQTPLDYATRWSSSPSPNPRHSTIDCYIRFAHQPGSKCRDLAHVELGIANESSSYRAQRKSSARAPLPSVTTWMDQDSTMLPRVSRPLLGRRASRECVTNELIDIAAVHPIAVLYWPIPP